ncbi:hypothetical protein [Clostridium chauvoei]|uniref:Uncharacterized protein n=2 Tax=Clostridium chauvoei TaxID=46867 RepID=S6FN83_9CLOT|nr:hypothetical protein [Clostridium chauvoei]ATD55404.1 hypothetical protein BTM20_09185 [Clostridium chauvoei]ATD56924.1 hypothetical protein BTM21_03855 [Clostridium chauvoei]MBX7280768.1 hypothetical protein [Clostridium chauvoei]MBX7283251.1 hypothetical protein [Clostridium chauvoei]MBX7285864.1 hypothetical protein [Clostridium chauvoei]
MDEIIRIKAGILSDIESEIYNNINGAVVKTIILHNSNDIKKEVMLNIDGVAFFVILEQKETRIINNTIMINSLKAIGEGINIHITGIQLGGV